MIYRIVMSVTNEMNSRCLQMNPELLDVGVAKLLVGSVHKKVALRLVHYFGFFRTVAPSIGDKIDYTTRFATQRPGRKMVFGCLRKFVVPKKPDVCNHANVLCAFEPRAVKKCGRVFSEMRCCLRIVICCASSAVFRRQKKKKLKIRLDGFTQA